MSRRRTYPFVHPLRGCGNTRGDAHPYQAPVPVGTWWAGDLRPCRAFALNGDEGRNNQHLGARHVSATPPRWEDYGHTVFTASPPQCAATTTTLHSPFSILNSSFSHTFSAKERDTETGLSYFGARYYSSDLSIWLSVDPMSDKYPSLSPYVYCADNPVKLVDPNGEEIDPESIQLWDALRSDIASRRDFMKQFASLNQKTGGKLFKKETEMYKSLCSTLKSMDDLECSDQMYKLALVDGNVGNVCLNDDKSLTINYCSTANFVHEVTHCVQFERGDIGFYEGKEAQAFTDVYDEIEAYTAQAAYDPTSIPDYSRRFTPLTPQWITHMRYDNGKYIYSNCSLIRYNGSATASEMNRIFPNSFEIFDYPGTLREQPKTYFK